MKELKLISNGFDTNLKREFFGIEDNLPNKKF